MFGIVRLASLRIRDRRGRVASVSRAELGSIGIPQRETLKPSPGSIADRYPRRSSDHY